ncbi:MAG: hypothetical protein ABIP59_22900 [Roseateles sp.]|uniref:hypothetical protein n=1 Tax=Roseateles sp. TaxID=1971397 RepID=UPI00326375A0
MLHYRPLAAGHGAAAGPLLGLVAGRVEDKAEQLRAALTAGSDASQPAIPIPSAGPAAHAATLSMPAAAEVRSVERDELAKS